ncbi:hypothetical protein QFC21_004206 [Naganishia friedmannii]|uniref:Uncharacterized protein n=1 Tax=Naganishia friedmannii TaxID=89922 RepID=A0ACC2VIU1_9TREE|nr:hypothetical protein QFC21_004206 [Naganishia friedmannii]
MTAEDGYEWIESFEGSDADPSGLTPNPYVEPLSIRTQRTGSGGELDPATVKTQSGQSTRAPSTAHGSLKTSENPTTGNGRVILVQAEASVQQPETLSSDEDALDMALAFYLDDAKHVFNFKVWRWEIAKNKDIQLEMTWTSVPSYNDVDYVADKVRNALSNPLFTRGSAWKGEQVAKLELEVVKNLVKQAKEQYQS